MVLVGNLAESELGRQEEPIVVRIVRQASDPELWRVIGVPWKQYQQLLTEVGDDAP